MKIICTGWFSQSLEGKKAQNNPISIWVGAVSKAFLKRFLGRGFTEQNWKKSWLKCLYTQKLFQKIQWDSPKLLFKWVTEVFSSAMTQHTAKFASILCAPPRRLKWRPVPPKHPESPQGSWDKWRNEVQSLNPFQVLECSLFSAHKGDTGTITFSFGCFPWASQQFVCQQLGHSTVSPHLCLLSRALHL